MSKTLIILLIVIVGIVGGVLLAQRLGGGNRITSSSTTTTVTPLSRGASSTGGTGKSATISSSLPEGANRAIGAFIEQVVEAAFLPSEIKIQKVAAGRDGRGDENAGQWTANNAALSVLFVPEKQGAAKGAYLRLWTMRRQEALDAVKSAAFLSQYFNASFLSKAGAPTCQKVDATVVCASMKLDTDGNKVGVLIRDGVVLPDGGKMIVVSACEIPAGSPIFKDTNFCI